MARRNMMPSICMSDRRLTDSIHLAFGLDDIRATVHEVLVKLADMVDCAGCETEVTNDRS